MFDGNVRSRAVSQNIGKKKEVERNRFLDSTRKQREERESSRKRLTCATKIQSLVRRFLTKSSVFLELRSEFDKKIKDINLLKALFLTKQSKFFVPIDVIFQIFRLFIFIHTCSTDFTRLQMILDLIIESFSHPNSAFNIYSMAIHEDIAINYIWHYQMSNLCQFLLLYHRSTSPNETVVLSKAKQILECILAPPQLWPIPTTKKQIQQFTKTQQVYMESSKKISLISILRDIVVDSMCISNSINSINNEKNSTRQMGNTFKSNTFINQHVVQLIMALVINGISLVTFVPSPSITVNISSEDDTITPLRKKSHISTAIYSQRTGTWEAFLISILSIPNLFSRSIVDSSATEPIEKYLIHNNCQGWRIVLQYLQLNASNGSCTSGAPVVASYASHLSNNGSVIQNTLNVKASANVTRNYTASGLIALLGNLCMSIHHATSTSKMSKDVIYQAFFAISPIWVPLLNDILSVYPLLSLVQAVENSTQESVTTKNTLDISLSSGKMEEEEEEEDDTLHESGTGGSGVRRLELMIRLQQRRCLREETPSNVETFKQHLSSLREVLELITEPDFVVALLHTILQHQPANAVTKCSSESISAQDTIPEFHPMDVEDEKMSHTDKVFQERSIETGFINFAQLPDVEQKLIRSLLIHIYSKLIMCCSPDIEFKSENNEGKRYGRGGGVSRMASTILTTLAFGRQAGVSLCQLLWEKIESEYNPNIKKSVLMEYSTAVSTTSSPLTFGSSISGITRAGFREFSNCWLLSALHLLCCGLSYQLLALDDIEVFQHRKTISVNNIMVITDLLKDLLYRMLWTNSGPIFTDTSTSTSSSSDVSQTSLVSQQLLLAAVRLFNQFLARNERRHFLSPNEWLWRGITSRDVSVELVSDTDGTRERSEGEDSSTSMTSLPTIRFSNPKLKRVLTLIPQVLEFNQRVYIFQQLVAAEKNRNDPGGLRHFTLGTSIQARVRRSHLVEDAFHELNHTSTNLKRRVQINFISEQGIEEAGIDGGGLLKEFLDSLTKAAFDPNFGLFSITATQLLIPNPDSANSAVGNLHILYFGFLGRILGKALYEGILIESQFAGVFLNALLGRQNTMDDLVYLDEQIYRSLLSIKKHAEAGHDLRELGLFFEATTVIDDQVHTSELIPGGSHEAVTNDNYISYIFLLANYKLNMETKIQSRAFLDGCRDIIPVDWLRMFGPHELQLLIGGDQRRIDVEDMRRNTKYGGGFHESQPYIQAFWELIEGMTVEEQADLLKFVTSCSRQPLLGFSHLNPPFCIQKVPGHSEDQRASDPPRLPSAATCMNLLKLPQYEDTSMLRSKLLYAIKSNSGFELT